MSSQVIPLGRVQSDAAIRKRKTEHPRPDFYRKQWLNLNGTWDFHFEEVSLLRKEGRNQSDREGMPQVFDYATEVPFAHQSELAHCCKKK